MAAKKCLPPFQMVVSEAKSVGNDESPYYYAEKNTKGQLTIQPLTDKGIPKGEPLPMAEKVFLEGYKPEPLIWFNKVKPAMDAVARHTHRGDELRAEGKHRTAAREYEAALAFDPDNVRASFGLGISYLESAKFDHASVIFDKLMGLETAFDPSYKHLFNEFGIRLRRCGLFEKGLVYYEKALALGEDDENLLFNMARMCYEMDRFVDAGKHLERALELNPDFDAAKSMKAMVDRLLAAEAAF